jgi:hypothetical protein
MFKKSLSVCTLTVTVSPDLVSPTPSSSAVKTPENTAEDPDDPWSADQGDIQIEYLSDKLCSSSTAAVTNNYPFDLRSV